MYVYDFYDCRFLNEKWIVILFLKLIENGYMWLVIYFKILKIKVVCVLNWYFEIYRGLLSFYYVSY